MALPLARPAIAAGVALVVMECLNDLGAVQYLGVETLSASIYATWMQRSNLGGAAQIAAVMLILVAGLLAAERRARGGARIHHTTGRYRAIPFQDLEGWKGITAAGVALLPFVLGFLVPLLVIIESAATHMDDALAGGFLAAAGNSLLLSALAAAVAIAVALTLGYARRVAPNGFVLPAVRASGFGYAVPGTVLAIGLLIPLAAFDNRVDAVLRATLGISSGLLLSGSLFAITLAYVIRFLAVALAQVEAGLERVSPNLDAAARTLGESALSTLWRVHLPLLLAPLGAAALLVFVDCMKELPATLLLRPFNFETLATHVYDLASIEQLEQAALSSLAIVLVGLVPVLLLHRAIAGGRPGSGRTYGPLLDDLLLVEGLLVDRIALGRLALLAELLRPADVQQRVAHVDDGQRRAPDDDAAARRAHLHRAVLVGVGHVADHLADVDRLADALRRAEHAAFRRAHPARGIDQHRRAPLARGQLDAVGERQHPHLQHDAGDALDARPGWRTRRSAGPPRPRS